MSTLPQNWRAIAERVNAEVNALPSVPDEPGRDFWQVAGAEGGDCEDKALAKLERLLAVGFPIERLRLASCWIGRTGLAKPGEPHIVLAIDANDDQYVLDNLSNSIMPTALFKGLGAVLDRIQKVGGSKEWVDWLVT